MKYEIRNVEGLTGIEVVGREILSDGKELVVAGHFPDKSQIDDDIVQILREHRENALYI